MVRANYPEPLEKEIAWNVEWERWHPDIDVDGAAEIEMHANNIRSNGVAARARIVREYFWSSEKILKCMLNSLYLI